MVLLSAFGEPPLEVIIGDGWELASSKASRPTGLRPLRFPTKFFLALPLCASHNSNETTNSQTKKPLDKRGRAWTTKP